MKKLIGFKVKDTCTFGICGYWKAPCEGYTKDKATAHIYSKNEIKNTPFLSNLLKGGLTILLPVYK